MGWDGGTDRRRPHAHHHRPTEPSVTAAQAHRRVHDPKGQGPAPPRNEARPLETAFHCRFGEHPWPGHGTQTDCLRGGGPPANNQHNPQYANYWAPLTHKRHIPPHPAQPWHTNDGAPRTRKRHQQEHRPQRPTERSDPTQHAKGRTGDCPGPRKGATTRRNVTQGGSTVIQSPRTRVGGAVPIRDCCGADWPRQAPRFESSVYSTATRHMPYPMLRKEGRREDGVSQICDRGQEGRVRPLSAAGDVITVVAVPEPNV